MSVEITFNKISLLQVPRSFEGNDNYPVFHKNGKTFTAVSVSKEADFEKISENLAHGDSDVFKVKDKNGNQHVVKSTLRRFPVLTTPVEAEMLEKLKHSNIAKAEGLALGNHLSQGERKLYFMMKDYECGSLSEHISNIKSFSAALKIIDQVASSLVFIHNNGFVHGDLNPDNILLDNSQNAYLTDLGTLKNLWGKDRIKIDPVGTEGYAPPEQIKGFFSTKTDSYSLAVSFLQILTKVSKYEVDELDPSLTPFADSLKEEIGDKEKALREIIKAALNKDDKLRITASSLNGQVKNLFRSTTVPVYHPVLIPDSARTRSN